MQSLWRESSINCTHSLPLCFLHSISSLPHSFTPSPSFSITHSPPSLLPSLPLLPLLTPSLPPPPPYLLNSSLTSAYCFSRTALCRVNSFKSSSSSTSALCFTWSLFSCSFSLLLTEVEELRVTLCRERERLSLEGYHTVNKVPAFLQ